jgi:hypothetical protein
MLKTTIKPRSSQQSFRNQAKKVESHQNPPSKSSLKLADRISLTSPSSLIRLKRSRSLENIYALKRGFLRRKSCACRGCGGLKLFYKSNRIESKKSLVKLNTSHEGLNWFKNSFNKVDLTGCSCPKNFLPSLFEANSNASNARGILYSPKPSIPNIMKLIQKSDNTTKGTKNEGKLVLNSLTSRLYLSSIVKQHDNFSKPGLLESQTSAEKCLKEELVDTPFKRQRPATDFRVRRLMTSARSFKSSPTYSFKFSFNPKLQAKKRQKISTKPRIEVINDIYSPENIRFKKYKP